MFQAGQAAHGLHLRLSTTVFLDFLNRLECMAALGALRRSAEQFWGAGCWCVTVSEEDNLFRLWVHSDLI